MTQINSAWAVTYTLIHRFLASAEYTLKLIKSEESVTTGMSRKFACTMNLRGFCAIDAVQNAFIHTLQTFEILLHSVSHSNGLTEESLATLSGQLDVVRHLAGGEIRLVSKEIGELLGSLWTQLGGNRKLIANAHHRYFTLNYTSVQTKAMQRLVFNVQAELYDLQVISDTLRAYAAHPLLLGMDIPKGGVVTALSEGCKGLRDRLDNIGAQVNPGESGEIVNIIDVN